MLITVYNLSIKPDATSIIEIVAEPTSIPHPKSEFILKTNGVSVGSTIGNYGLHLYQVDAGGQIHCQLQNTITTTTTPHTVAYSI